MHYLEKNIFQIKPQEFETITLELFRYQAQKNPIYAQFIKHLNINITKINRITDIPFLPIELFKNHTILCENQTPKICFESSRTTSDLSSKHYVSNPDFYLQNAQNIFEKYYGALSQYHILALLPSYLERENSSLIYMVQDFIKKTNSPHSDFYLYNLSELNQKLKQIAEEKNTKKTLVIGVSFALLEWIEKDPPQKLPLQTIVMETGGMKGRRKELLREELHQQLLKQLPLQRIHSEYGMTELLSQAYLQPNQYFEAPQWLKILLRETDDPLQTNPKLKRGVINIIDLANFHSCAFIATQDIGEKNDHPQQFKVLGRTDHSEIRGCNLLVQDI
ncbi:MAG: acyl transferase [Cytophagales bacterium]|nr:MAG: acyl transferase [Cytophagales bacterium]